MNDFFSNDPEPDYAGFVFAGVDWPDYNTVIKSVITRGVLEGAQKKTRACQHKWQYKILNFFLHHGNQFVRWFKSITYLAGMPTPNVFE
jgi:hypothetical protein